ncbi:heptaprenyl diphosphate synthase [Bacilli bacterium PM5-3]|nr:heptaprenyl diphosphate synthase [Bacilli bacterium PM5-3]MDH6603095.1 heptaprenyl diphosphate synthase [Bacilli bacterium PM5-9]
MMSNTKKIVVLSLFLALAIILNIVENVVFSFFIIPGIKMGLANISTIFILYYFGYKEMFLVNVLRVILANLVTGLLFSIPFTIAIFSSVCSMLILYFVLKIEKLSIFGISMIQAVVFNIFQIIIVSFLYQSNVFFYYMPYLLISGVITGYLVALSAKFIIKIMDKIVL